MRNLIRSPLTWLVVAEMVVAGALIVVAWTVAGNAARAMSSASSAMLPAQATDAPSPLPDLPDIGAPGPHGPLPGLNLDSRFWRERLAQLNRDQILFVQLEWRVIHAAMDAAQRYVDTIVLPAVRAAEGAVP